MAQKNKMEFTQEDQTFTQMSPIDVDGGSAKH